MGGTKILAAAINSREGIKVRVKRPTELGKSGNDYVKALAEIVNDVIKEGNLDQRKIKAVCLGVPAAVNPLIGRIGIAPNLGIKNFMIKDKLQKLVPFPVLVENDVNIGALGIKGFGAGKDAKNMMAVFVGTGIGGAVIVDGKMYRGSGFLAGEIGHIVVEKDGPECGCGNRGCFEAVASRTAIVRNIRKDLKAGKKSEIAKFVKGGRIKSSALAAAVAHKDKVVINRLTEACEVIGTTLAGAANLMNFDMIVLGGGVIEALEKFLLPRIKDAFNRNVMKETGKGVRLLASRLGDDAALYGGIPLAEEFLGVKV